MAEPLFDDEARVMRRRRALAREPQPFLSERIVDEWLERLVPVRRVFGRALATGVPPALHSRLHGVAREIAFADSIDALAEHEGQSLHLILVMGELDTRDELPLLLRIIASRLAPGGLFAGTVPGGQSLPALRAALLAADQAGGSFVPRLHPLIEASAFAGLLSAAGLAEPVVDIDRLRLRYRALERLVGDLRDHAATNILRARSRLGLGKERLRRAREAFAAAAGDGATEERIELIHFAAWAPSSQNRA